MKEEEKKTPSTNRVSSPEQLNDYIRVSSPSVWIVLGIVIALLLAAIVWGLFGTVNMIDSAGNATPVHPIIFVTN